MKKPLIALSFAVASALALADSAQNNEGWFKGIGDGATSTNDMKATNGSWQFPATEGCATVNESGALVLALDEDDEGTAEEATFKITDEGETGTAQTLSVTGVFNPISAEDLLAGTKMVEKNAQVGFAVVGAEAAEGAMAYKYYAWVGATGNATAAADWAELSELGTVADPEASTALTIELNYWDANKMTATFKIGDKSAMKTLTSAAAQNKKIASVSCTGSGTLSALNGAYQYAVAEAEGRKFGTADEAIAAAQSEGGSGEIKLLKAVSGSVEVSGGLRVWQNNDEALKASVTSSFTHKEETSYPTSATVSAKGYHEWQVNNDVLESVVINGKKIGMGSAGFVLQDAFRTFLEKNCGDAYRSSTVTKDTLAEALNGNGTNGYPLWQSFVMGVDADETVKLAPATTDTEADGISLKLASTIPASPYDSAIKYTVTKNGGTAGTATAITRTSPVVKIPLETGRYSVKFTIGE